MNFKEYIGFNIEEVEPLLIKENVNYKIVEVLDPKNNKLGNDIRIINVQNENDIIKIYVAYF